MNFCVLVHILSNYAGRTLKEHGYICLIHGSVLLLKSVEVQLKSELWKGEQLNGTT